MNWYLTEDLIQQGLTVKPSQKSRNLRIMAGDIESLFKMFTCMVDPHLTFNITTSALWSFEDSGVQILLTIRKGVAVLSKGGDPLAAHPDVTVECTELVWRQVLCDPKSLLTSAVSGNLKVTPGVQALVSFLGYFDTEV